MCSPRDDQCATAPLHEGLDTVLFRSGQSIEVVVIQYDKLRVVEVGWQGFRSAEVEFIGGEHADYVFLGAFRILRYPDYFRPAHRDRILEARFTHTRRGDFSAEVYGSRGVESRPDANAIFARGEGDLVRTDGLSLGGEFNCGSGRFRRIDGEVDGKVFAGEHRARNSHGFGLELGLCASGQRNGVDGDADLLRLPCCSSGGAVIFIAVGDQDDAMDHAGRQRRQRFADGRFDIRAASRPPRRCAEDEDWLQPE